MMPAAAAATGSLLATAGRAAPFEVATADPPCSLSVSSAPPAAPPPAIVGFVFRQGVPRNRLIRFDDELYPWRGVAASLRLVASAVLLLSSAVLVGGGGCCVLTPSGAGTDEVVLLALSFSAGSLVCMLMLDRAVFVEARRRRGRRSRR